MSDDVFNPEDRLRSLTLRSEDPGFAPDQLIPCTKCSRPNAPNRASCIYCGQEFEGAAGRRLDIRELEDWEKGFNVIVTGSSGSSVDQAATSLAGITGFEVDSLSAILSAEHRLPIARVEGEEQAAAISELLSTHGIQTRTVCDEALVQSSTPARLRSVEFGRDHIVLNLFSGVESQRLATDELALIVVGALFTDRTETLEKRKRGETKTLSSTQLTSDEPVLDIYSKSDATGWRIPASGFDFSCLGTEKSLIVAENMERLTQKFRYFAPRAKLVDDYVQVRALLEHCWPTAKRKDAYGFQRSGFGRKDLASAVTTSNSIQLTKYSRLQWNLL